MNDEIINGILTVEEEDLVSLALPQNIQDNPESGRNMAPRVFPSLINNDTRAPSYVIPPWQTALLGSMAALAGWWLMEYFFPNDPFTINPFGSFTGMYWLTNAIPAGFIGLFLGSAPGISRRVWSKSLSGAGVALALTLAAGALGSFSAQFLYLYVESIQGSYLYLLVFAKVLSWMIFGIFIGFGQAIVTGEGIKMGHGICGGLMGGLLAGLIFSILDAHLPGSIAARACAYGIMGLSIGAAAGWPVITKANKP